MRFRKFTIDNYRAVHHAEVPVGNNMIPLIGINESGKTSILQAILAFDKLSDRYGGGAHLEYRNKYKLADHDATITADVVIDQEDDLDALSKRLKLSRGDPLLLDMEQTWKDHRSIQLKRHLETRKYTVEGLSVPEGKEEAVARAIYSELPFILYFDDFTDRVPDRIAFVRKEGGKGYRLTRSKLAVWQRILEEVFDRATEGEHTLRDFIEIGDEDRRRGLLNDIEDVLNTEVVEYWRRLKQVGSDLADDPGDLRLLLTFHDRSPKGFQFQFKVEDRSSARGRVFPIGDRSKGFQWFFNFHMKLRFNPKYKRVKEGAIYLLDEPGSYLHASAQTELLGTLQDISETNSILYCTHSQHLLDPEKINIGNIRITEKEEAKVKVVPFGSAGGGYKGALSPLYDALHLKTGVFNREIRRAIVTEGITDYYLFRILMSHHADWNFDKTEVIPGAGAQQLKDLISMCVAWAEDYRVFLDSDREGRRAFKRYKTFFGEAEAERIVLYTTPGNGSGVKLEHFLSKSDQNRLLTLTQTSSIKAGLAALHYGPVDAMKEFVSKLTKKTHQNLSGVHREMMELNA